MSPHKINLITLFMRNKLIRLMMLVRVLLLRC